MSRHKQCWIRILQEIVLPFPKMLLKSNICKEQKNYVRKMYNNLYSKSLSAFSKLSSSFIFYVCSLNSEVRFWSNFNIVRPTYTSNSNFIGPFLYHQVSYFQLKRMVPTVTQFWTSRIHKSQWKRAITYSSV